MKNKITKYTSTDDISFFLYIRKIVVDLYDKRYFIKLLFLRTLKNRYKGSVLGLLWTLLSPIITMITMALIFPLIMKFRIENYVVYLFSGFMGWHLISSSITNGGSSILSRSGLLKKYSLPKIIIPFTVSLVEVFNFFITLMALIIVLFLLNYDISINVLYLMATFFITYIFGLSLSIMASVLFVYIRDLQHLIGVLMQGLFYLTPIIYTVAIIPAKYMYLMNLNIFYYYIHLFHGSIYDESLITIESFLIPSLISIFTLIFSLLIFKTLEKNIIYRL